jgi:hypothetical protein
MNESLSSYHQAFIDEITMLIDNAKSELTDEFLKSFDLDAILQNPEYGKKLMEDLMVRLEDYLSKAGEVGQTFGEVKREAFNAS